jgi:hypothetical protein
MLYLETNDRPVVLSKDTGGRVIDTPQATHIRYRVRR